MREIIIGSVKPFPDVKPDKEQALKPLEEASEVFGAWQRAQSNELLKNMLGESVDYEVDYKSVIVDECCDVIQATCNLLASLGVYDVTGYMKDCELRNRERGRYAD